MKQTTEDQIIEGNKLIAEFMGYKFNAYPKLKHNNITKPNENEWYYASYDSVEFNNTLLKELQYHTSWDWVMPACKKFDNLNLDFIEYPNLCDEIDRAVTCYEIKPVFEQLVKAIKWYNQNTLNK